MQSRRLDLSPLLKKWIWLALIIFALMFALGNQPVKTQEEQYGQNQTQATVTWLPYADRFAVIVMGGDEGGQMYEWYWGDTYGMYQHLRTLGFTDANIYFLAYGYKVAQHPGVVDRESTKANVQWAFDQVRTRSTMNDLVYIFWVDHGNNQLFNLHNGQTITHAEYNDCIKNIAARVIIGAYNPYLDC